MFTKILFKFFACYSGQLSFSGVDASDTIFASSACDGIQQTDNRLALATKCEPKELESQS